MTFGFTILTLNKFHLLSSFLLIFSGNFLLSMLVIINSRLVKFHRWSCQFKIVAREFGELYLLHYIIHIYIILYIFIIYIIILYIYYILFYIYLLSTLTIKMDDVKTFVGSFVAPFHREIKRMIFNRGFPFFQPKYRARFRSCNFSICFPWHFCYVTTTRLDLTTCIEALSTRRCSDTRRQYHGLRNVRSSTNPARSRFDAS